MGSLDKNILLTVRDYDIELSRQIKFYEGDNINLYFTIMEYGTVITEDNKVIHKLIQINPKRAFMLIQSPKGKDYVEATSIKDNNVVFKLGRKHSEYVGIGRLQIVVLDEDDCRATLPEFNFEIKQCINSYWEEGELPEEPEGLDYMYYGRITAVEAGVTNHYIEFSEMTPDMILNAQAVTRARCSTMGKTSFGLEEETRECDYLIVVVPESKNYVVTKDNGIGGKVKFDETNVTGSANGLNMVIDGKNYLLYGECIMSPCEIFFYID